MIALGLFNFPFGLGLAKHHHHRENEKHDPARNLKRSKPQSERLKKNLPSDKERKQDHAGNKNGAHGIGTMQVLGNPPHGKKVNRMVPMGSITTRRVTNSRVSEVKSIEVKSIVF